MRPSDPAANDSKLVHSTPDDPPWNSPVAIGVWFASVLAIVIFPAILLLPYLISLKGQFADNAALAEYMQSDPTAILLQVIAVIPAHAATLLLAWLVVTNNRRFSFRQTLGWTSGGFKWWHYVIILVAFFALAGTVNSFYPEQDNDLLRMLRSSRTAVFFVAFMATFTAPLVEEVIYRGILYSAFQRTFGVAAAVAAVTFLFALVHVPQYYPSVSTIFLLTLLSLMLTLIRVKTGSLLPCIIFHTLFNGIQSIFLILEPYIQNPAAVPQPVPAIFLLLK